MNLYRHPEGQARGQFVTYRLPPDFAELRAVDNTAPVEAMPRYGLLLVHGWSDKAADPTVTVTYAAKDGAVRQAECRVTPEWLNAELNPRRQRKVPKSAEAPSKSPENLHVSPGANDGRHCGRCGTLLRECNLENTAAYNGGFVLAPITPTNRLDAKRLSLVCSRCWAASATA